MEKFTFYSIYADILKSMTEEEANAFAMAICRFEFEDEKPAAWATDTQAFYWSTITDMLQEVKAVESTGAKTKKYSYKFKHFEFKRSYHNALKLLPSEKHGAFVLGLYDFFVEGKQPKFGDKTIKLYFDACTINAPKKKRSKPKPKDKKTADCPADMPEPTQADAMTYEQFKALHPDLEGELFGSGERYIKDTDWADLHSKLAIDTELADQKHIYYLIKKYEQKYPKDKEGNE